MRVSASSCMCVREFALCERSCVCMLLSTRRASPGLYVSVYASACACLCVFVRAYVQAHASGANAHVRILFLLSS